MQNDADYMGHEPLMPEKRRRFIADAIHDLGNPITIMKLRLDLMRKAPDRLHEHLAAMEYQIERLEDLVQDMLMLSRLDLRILTTELKLLNLNYIVQRVFHALEPMSKRKNLTFLLDTDPDLPQILVDERQLERVVVNLVSNAINYTPANGLVLVTTTHADDEILLVVGDNGIGIDAEELPYVFERFYRSNSAKNLNSGSGLGLSIVKEIVENYRGTIEVHSTRYKGSRFTVHLPIWNPKAADYEEME